MEINAYMNGYKSDEDNEFLTASLEAHKQEVKRLKGILKTLNVVCENCGFEYHKQHEVDTPEGGYSCPLCDLQEAQNEIITAKEFLYQHIQTNKELEKKIDEIVTGIENALHYVDWNKEEAERILKEVLQIALND
ncbi:hypothetical protein [Fictibacillus nanhaiensis]|uniref:hypothetical protein n=1 Tax=Fictibacillus nanhaiensis TaxID=742169 RepID=UPI003C293AFF